MLHIAKKRICPSLSCSSCAKVRRQAAGDRNGNRPSTTSTKASASQMVSLSKVYFFDEAPPAEPPLRKTLKNSDPAGSSTMTSLLFAKEAL